MPHPLEIQIKAINDKSFIPSVNLNQSVLSDFWKNLTDYLFQYGEKNRKESSFLKKARHADCPGIVKALIKIINDIKPNHFTPEMLPLINKAFCQFLHPESPRAHREAIINFLFKIAEIMPSNTIEPLFPAFSFVVPFSCCAQNEQERIEFMSYISKSEFKAKIINGSQTPPTVNDAAENLKMLLKFYLMNWSLHESFCVRSLFEHVLYIIYRPIAESMHCPSINRGFKKAEAPLELRREVTKFFKDFLTATKNLEPLLSQVEHSRLIIGIFRSVKACDNLDNVNSLIEFLTMILTVPNYLDKLLEAKNNEKTFIINEAMNVICQYLTDLSQRDASPPVDVLVHASTFVTGYCTTLFERFEKDKILVCLSSLFHCNQYLKYASSFVMIVLFNYLITMGEWSPNIWELLTQIITESEVLSAVASHYAQYLAVYIFPCAYELSVDKSLEENCMNHVKRKQRTKQDTPHDFVAENITKILTKPEQFVQDSIRTHLEPHKAYDKLVSTLRIEPLTVADRKGKFNDVIAFIDAFEFYPKMDSKAAKQMAFFPIVSFCHALSELRYIPAGIQYNKTAVFSICANRLFKATAEQNDPVIRSLAFDVLCQLINTSEMKTFLDERILSNWYATLLYMVLSSDQKMRNKGFAEAVKTLQIGFVGSTILCSPLMALCEGESIEINDSYISFVTLFPLFVKNSALPNNFSEYILKDIEKARDLYVTNAPEILKKTGNDLNSRSMNLIDKLHSSQKWDLVLPAYSAILSSFMSQDPSSRPIAKVVNLINKLLDPLKNRSKEALVTVRSIMMYADTFCNVIPQQWSSFIYNMTDLCLALNPSDSANWSFELIKLTAEAYLQSFSCIKYSTKYIEFAKFLSNSTKDKVAFAQPVSRLMYNMIDLLSIQYGRYPFPETSNFPTHTEPTVNSQFEEPIFATNKTIICAKAEEDNSIKIMSQTTAGQFVWNFKEIDDQLFNDSRRSDSKISFQSFTSNNKEIVPSFQYPKEKEFCDIFDNMVVDFERTFNEKFKSDEIPNSLNFKLKEITDTVSQKYNQCISSLSSNKNNSINTNTDTWKVKNNYDYFPDVKFLTKAQNPAAAALLACGRYKIHHPDNFQKINDNSQVKLMLRKAQGFNHRLGVKIGVVYVDEKCDNQNDLLSIPFENTTKHFQEFITGLGWPVDLSTHAGYDGGLDIKNAKNGKTSIYFANFTNETMFHIAPLIPTDKDDVQQIYKKRHIGNDHIHIVWCEKSGEYDVTTITSQFNQAHIVIYPLNTGLFRVDICWRKELAWFGPLRYPTVVTKKELPSLVRATAVAAMGAFYETQKDLEFAYRQNEVTNICMDVIAKEIQKCESSYDPLQMLMNSSSKVKD